MPENTTLITISNEPGKENGFNWLMVNRWEREDNGNLMITFSDGCSPLIVPKGDEADTLIKYLSSISDKMQVRKKKAATEEATAPREFSLG